MKTLPRDEGVSNNNIIKQFRTLLYNESNLSDSVTYTHRILSFCKSIFSSKAVSEAFIYLCRTGATTAWLLQVQLDMPEATAYRALKRLRSLKIIEPVLKLNHRKQRRGGPWPTVWGLIGNYTEEEVAKCINLHRRTLSPKYRVAEEIAQTLLEGYIMPREIAEISYREILIHIREMRIPFRSLDIAHLAAQYLGDKGVKVWR